MNNFSPSDISQTDGQKRIFPQFDPSGLKSIIVFCAAILLIVGLTFTVKAVFLIEAAALRLALTSVIIVLYTAVAVFAMKLTGQAGKLVPSKNKLWLQLLYGAGIAAVLCFFIGVVPILCGTSLIGSHTEPSALIAWYAVEDIIFVGFGEELVFRGYIQNQFEIWLKKYKVFAPLIAALLFGLWHLVNGSLIQVLFTALIGCVFGYAKYFLKHCTLLSVSVAHGLYDFSLVLLCCFML